VSGLLTSLVAVFATLAGSALTFVFQRHAARQARAVHAKSAGTAVRGATARLFTGQKHKSVGEDSDLAIDQDKIPIHDFPNVL